MDADSLSQIAEFLASVRGSSERLATACLEHRVGAAFGGIAGGAIGNYQDRQEQKLRQQMAGTGVRVVRKDEVAGHTDSPCSAEYDQKLAERRANSVAAYLESRGVDAKRLIVVGDGEKDPI